MPKLSTKQAFDLALSLPTYAPEYREMLLSVNGRILSEDEKYMVACAVEAIEQAEFYMHNNI